MPDNTVDTCVTSPPYYGLRDYGIAGQIGLEISPQAYVEKLTGVFREVRRVLKSTGTMWLNIADSYAGSGKGAWRKPPADRPKSKTIDKALALYFAQSEVAKEADVG